MKKVKEIELDVDWLSFWVALWITLFTDFGANDFDLYDALVKFLMK